MGYTMRSGRYANTEDVVLAPLALRNNASATGPEVELGDRGVLRLRLAVTTETGTAPTLNVTIETSKTGAPGTWYEAGTFDEVEEETGDFDTVFLIDRFVRAKWEVGGSGGAAFTFGLSGEAV